MSIDTHEVNVQALGNEPVASADIPESKPMQPRFDCLFYVYEDEQLVRKEPIQIDPADAKQCNDVHHSALEYLHSKEKKPRDRSNGSEKFYRKSGWCELIDDSTKTCTNALPLVEDKEWIPTIEYLLAIVVQKRRDERRDAFHLELHWNYSHLSLFRGSESFSETLRNVLHSKKKENFDGIDFWSRRDIDEIFTLDVVQQLVDANEQSMNDNTILCDQPLNIQQFVSRTQSSATRLLALWIWVNLPLKYLYRLVMSPGSHDGAIEDVDLPLQKHHCPDPDNPSVVRLFDELLKKQAGFNAWVFDRDGPELHRITHPPESVMPLMWAEGDREKSKLGDGSFGVVYKMKIDPNHQNLDVRKNNTFALKEFYHHGARTSQDFKKEEEALIKLSSVNDADRDNIATIFSSWTHKDIFYMLMPCADCNLRELISSPQPQLTQDRMLSIIGAMRGLAYGLQTIHRWGFDLSLKQKPDATKRSRRSNGYHHDLKPENILVYDSDKHGNFTAKIGDFGSARIGLVASGKQQVLSHLTDRLPADTGYASPDQLLA